MNFKLITTVLLIGLGLQSCSYFKPSECKNQQVTNKVKQLYATQVNANPLSQLNKLTEKLRSSSKTEFNISTIGIELVEIKQLDLQKLQVDQTNKKSVELATLITGHFEDAQIICQGTIQQKIKTNKLTDITKQLVAEESELIQDDHLNIPVVYGIYQHAESEQFEVQYVPKNTLHLILAMGLRTNE